MTAKVITILKPIRIATAVVNDMLYTDVQAEKVEIHIDTQHNAEDQSRPIITVELFENGEKRNKVDLEIGSTCTIEITKHVSKRDKCPVKLAQTLIV